MDASVALVGDSLRMDYQPVVAQALAGVASVWGPEISCESSRHLRANLDAWVLGRIDRLTIIHVNAGAHDLRRFLDDDWEVQVPIDEYRENMLVVLDRLAVHAHVGQVIVATTLPIDEDRHDLARHSTRRNSDVEAYNHELIDVASERGIAVDDLWMAEDS